MFQSIVIAIEENLHLLQEYLRNLRKFIAITITKNTTAIAKIYNNNLETFFLSTIT